MDYVLAFIQDDLDADVFIELTLGMVFEGNRGKYMIKSNKSLDVLKQASKNWFDILNTGP